MSTAAIRQKLHSYLEVADDHKVKAIYAIMEQAVEEAAVVYDEKLKANLRQRVKDHKAGKMQMVSPSESKERIKEILNSKTSSRKK